MIDVSKCEFEESYSLEDLNAEVFYFAYPFDLNEVRFTFDNRYYNKIVSMYIALTIYDGNTEWPFVMISPTIDDGGSTFEINWVELLPHINYTPEDVGVLLKKAREAKRR